MNHSKLAIGTRKGVLIFERSTGNWELKSESLLGVKVPYAMRDQRTNTIWACTEHGHWGSKIYNSNDEGDSWTEIQCPKYPEDAKLPKGDPATLDYPWVMATGSENQPNRLYLGTIPGGLFISDDGGKSFELNGPLWNHPSRKDSWFGGGFDEAGIHSILVDPNDENHLLVGISVAGVFETFDACETWQPVNKGLTADFLPDANVEVGFDPHLVAQSKNHPQSLWQQNHCGIFRSTDYSKNWEKVSQDGGPAHFGFAIAVDNDQPEQAWVVPAMSDEVRIAIDRKLCICRTEDGGKSWQSFSQGLPQEHCYDIVFRHALDKTGDTLVFGTSTGSLYFSDDRGETWQAIGEHLPQILSTRFI